MKKLLYISLALLLVMGLFVIGCGETEVDEPVDEEVVDEEPAEEVVDEPAGDPIVWEAACGWPRGNVHREQAELYAEMLAEATNGELTLNIVGPETIPGPDQIEVLSTGALDLVITVTAYYLQDLPEASFVHYVMGSREDRAAAGVYEFLDEIHRERYNATHLTESPAGYMHVYTTEPIESIEDFAGKRFRSPPAYMAGLEEMGATTMFMGDADTIDALNSGVLEGLITAHVTYDQWNYVEVAPYTIYPPMAFNATHMFCNVDSVENLPAHLRDALYDTMEEAEPLMDDLALEMLEEIEAQADEKGFQEVHFEGEEADEYYAIWFEAYMENVVRPESGDEVADRLWEIYNELI